MKRLRKAERDARLTRDPNSPLSFWVSISPFFAPMTMPVRILAETPPFWQIALAVATAGPAEGADPSTPLDQDGLHRIVRQGMHRAEQAIDSGAAAEQLRRWVKATQSERP